SWRSTNSEVATVDVRGNVTARANGSATIIADADGVEASAAVSVKQKAVQVTVAPKTAAATAIGQAVSFTATALDARGAPLDQSAITWSRGDPSIATVDAFGGASARVRGTASIIATCGDVSDAAQLSVYQVAAMVLVWSDRGQIAIGQTARLSARLADANGYVIQVSSAAWMSARPDVAAVSATGMVT